MVRPRARPLGLPGRPARCRGSQEGAAAVCKPPRSPGPPLAESAFFGPAKQYVRWDTGLHEVFVAAVEELGGAHAGARRCAAPGVLPPPPAARLPGAHGRLPAQLPRMPQAPRMAATAGLASPAFRRPLLTAATWRRTRRPPPRTAAKPAVIRERMGIDLLTTAQVKSHLQKYRIRVVAEGKAADAATEAQVRGGRGRCGMRGACCVCVRRGLAAGAAPQGAAAAGSGAGTYLHWAQLACRGSLLRRRRALPPSCWRGSGGRARGWRRPRGRAARCPSAAAGRPVQP